MKKIIFALVMALFCAGAQAQPKGQGRRHFNPGEFKAFLEKEIQKSAHFTDDEAAKFFPIFHEMHDKQRALNIESGKLKHETNAESGDEASQKAINRIIEIKAENAKIEQAYYNRMCKAVPAAKVLKAMKAEDKIHRDMLKRMGERKQQKAQDKK